MTSRFQAQSNSKLELAFEINFRAAGIQLPSAYITNHSSLDGTALVIDGQEYTTMPIEASGFREAAKGTGARPSLLISNLMGYAGSLISATKSLLNVAVICRWFAIDEQGNTAVYKTTSWKIHDPRLTRSKISLVLSNSLAGAALRSPRRKLGEL